MILKFSLVISLVCYKDMDIEALVPASVSHHCLVLSCLVLSCDFDGSCVKVGTVKRWHKGSASKRINNCPAVTVSDSGSVLV